MLRNVNFMSTLDCYPVSQMRRPNLIKAAYWKAPSTERTSGQTSAPPQLTPVPLAQVGFSERTYASMRKQASTLEELLAQGAGNWWKMQYTWADIKKVLAQWRLRRPDLVAAIDRYLHLEYTTSHPREGSAKPQPAPRMTENLTLAFQETRPNLDLLTGLAPEVVLPWLKLDPEKTES